jgi:hypothetical protein
MAEWGPTSFDNDPACEWFFRVEETVEPGGVIALAPDNALGEADHLGVEESCEAIAAAVLSASCAGHASVRLPDRVCDWVDTHPHRPHDSEIDAAVQAVERVRAESGLRDYWDERIGDEHDRWLGEVDDLIARLKQSGAGEPATLSP